ncbi:phasin family protein [Bradyrhizobium yuanmingense]|uniref:phasin family protein n=1 Tax=Bradyrhizobium yuanmingense TaxID=108015 RepID=UPI0021A6E597|nr:phasin family protein [Bradyrhizobium sp. CB1024]UWU87775.1 phasin family protein [Bradyrhizobium sp. CB1024]
MTNVLTELPHPMPSRRSDTRDRRPPRSYLDRRRLAVCVDDAAAKSHHIAATQATAHNRDFSANATEARGFIDIQEPFAMLSAVDNKPRGKSGRRGGKKKSGHRTGAGEQRASAAHQLPDAPAETRHETGQEPSRPISAEIPSAAALPNEASGMELAASPPVAPVEPLEASTQAIADAYSDYIRTSLEQAWSFLGKLATARSPVEAFELQMAYAKQACDSFVAESQKITELHEQLTRERVMHLEGFVARLTQTTLEIRTIRH